MKINADSYHAKLLRMMPAIFAWKSKKAMNSFYAGKLSVCVIYDYSTKHQCAVMQGKNGFSSGYLFSL